MKRKLLATAVFLSIATLTIVVAFSRGSSSPVSPSPATSHSSPGMEQVLRAAGMQPISGVKAVDFRLDSLDGSERTLADYRGRVVFLNFWATWCPPCVEEMPAMQRLADALEKQGLVMVAVNVQEEREPVQRFVTDLNLRFEVLLDRRGQVGRAYAVRGLPTTVILDRSGTIIARKIGFAIWDTDEMIELFRTIVDQT